MGQKTEISLDAYRNENFEGKVDHISYESKLVNNVNVYIIDIVLEEIPPTFRSGMTANVTFIVSEKKDVLVVPSDVIAEWPRHTPKPKDAEFAVYQKGFSGIILASVIASLITMLAHWKTVISMGSLILAFVFSVVVGIVFGLWPAKQASELEPIESLRYE